MFKILFNEVIFDLDAVAIEIKLTKSIFFISRKMVWVSVTKWILASLARKPLADYTKKKELNIANTLKIISEPLILKSLKKYKFL